MDGGETDVRSKFSLVVPVCCISYDRAPRSQQIQKIPEPMSTTRSGPT